MSTAAAPRRRGVAATTAAIESAAVELVLEHGYDDVTVDMICARAGVSQRTFFNHFKTKDAALLGPDVPTIDERAAREFIVSDGPLLAGAVRLVRIEPEHIPTDPQLIMRRIRAISGNPMLLARQMERLTAVEGELREIIELRLRQDALREGAGHEELAEIPEQAEITTHLLAGLMRYIGLAWARGAEEGAAPPDDAQLAARLERVIRKLG
ncbi:TetR/AcrR family transcriptional regulator [Agromyces aurantiacus]|uniref:TetR/AcrR family transcriptional regulator n=1 Tax=Agromyces aurantiacus TaxID=165814 RepID=A0ABV9R514_9MICO|nr:TetR/AcrR family transcriptional regulator [Agromyces aurantiacus]MBM7503595.1 AcrR family transcriptional regulator [Agromyces aurantiacus]